MKKKERIKIKLYLVLGALFVLAAVTALGWRYYLRTIQRNGIGDMLSGEEYERHYVMIPEDSSSGIWQDIYASAKAAGAESGAYVELMSDWSAGEYTEVCRMVSKRPCGRLSVCSDNRYKREIS
ncbi:MAG TPA: hypothetical protein IAB97_09400 [Candidatus Choladousia intestinipullorum]|nr:hypothetical protein [Candidatus Choladousia intestinipullorum]